MIYSKEQDTLFNTLQKGNQLTIAGPYFLVSKMYVWSNLQDSFQLCDSVTRSPIILYTQFVHVVIWGWIRKASCTLEALKKWKFFPIKY